MVGSFTARGVSSLALNASGTRLGAGNDERRVLVWDVEAGQVLHSLGGHQYPVQALTFDPESRHLVTAGADGTVRSYWLDAPDLVAQARKQLAR